MDKLYRMRWNRKDKPNEWFYGPALYLTNRTPEPFLKILRPYTLPEAMRAAKYFNENYKRGLHEVEEVQLEQ